MTLTIQDLGALGELLGSVAVLATLVYLALQMRQNTTAITAQLDSARIIAALNQNLTAATSSELQEALNGDRVEPLTIEQARLNHYWVAVFFQLQWNWIQFRRGLLTLNEPGMAPRVATYFNDFRSVEGWWEARKVHGFRPEFVEEARSKAPSLSRSPQT